MVDYPMIYTTILLGLYILSVSVLLVTARLKPEGLYRLHPILLLGLYSFIPAVALGLQMLHSELWMLIDPPWLAVSLIGLAGLAIIMIIPIRRWAHRSTLEISSKAAREHLERLPERMMAIEVQLSHGKLDQGEADQAKARIHRQADRLAFNDGLGRFLYALLKLHLLRLSLQVAGAIAINAWADGTFFLRMLTIASSLIIFDGLFIFLPYLLLLSVILLGRQS